jgi:hypothetical protein
MTIAFPPVNHYWLGLPQPQKFINLGLVETDHELAADLNDRHSLLPCAAYYVAGSPWISRNIHFFETDSLLSEILLGSPAKTARRSGEDNYSRLLAFCSFVHVVRWSPFISSKICYDNCTVG